jgi:predicted O-methyltransferase YrrM
MRARIVFVDNPRPSGLANTQAVAASPPYEFTADWFSGNIYLFARNLEHLRDEPCRILEIGSHEGRSAVWMLQQLATHPDARITCVDPNVRPAFRVNIERTGHGAKLHHIAERSADTLVRLETASFDFIYVDGSHLKADVLEDAVLSFRLAKPGGIIAFDDYTEDGPEWNERDFAKPALDAFLEIYGDRLDVLERCHQIWIRKRQP